MIARINELAHKQKSPEGLTPEEKDEQAKLRRQYIDSIKANVKAQLNNIDIVEKDGSITNLGEKYGNK
jgi:5-formyltetrahydrofolate cyclo-ligase